MSMHITIGLGDFLPAGRMLELLVGGYPSESSDRLGEVVATLFGMKALKIDKDGWTLIRAHMSAPDFRAMLTQLFEMSCDGMHQMASLLSDMFNVDDEFEIAETIRLVLESHWILDILPSKRKAAQRILRGAIVERFPYTEKVVDDFCQEILRLEPPIDKVASGASVSSDSEIESKGSLNEFVVDSDEEDGDETGSEDESEYSSSADDESPVRRKSHMRNASVSSSSSREVVPKKKGRREVKSLSSDSASFDSDYR